MAQTTPRVYAHWLEDPATPGHDIRLDSPAWFAWLDASTTTRFAYPIYDPCCGYIIGVMTVRKERRKRGGAYWSIYRRVAGRMHKHYLGHPSAVTKTRLEAVAAQLLAAGSADTAPIVANVSEDKPKLVPDFKL